MNPFKYDEYEPLYVSKEVYNENKHISLSELNKAEYEKNLEGVFNNRKLEKGKLYWQNFRYETFNEQPAINRVIKYNMKG